MKEKLEVTELFIVNIGQNIKPENIWTNKICQTSLEQTLRIIMHRNMRQVTPQRRERENTLAPLGTGTKEIRTRCFNVLLFFNCKCGKSYPKIQNVADLHIEKVDLGTTTL